MKTSLMNDPRAAQDVAAPRIGPAASGRPVVILAGYLETSPHFLGIPEALDARGMHPVRMTEIDPGATLFFPDAAALIVCDSDRESPLCRYALRRAAASGVRVLLLMDGILEWRNTFLNPRLERDFLRPAPVELIACAGERDRRILESLGNNAVATGLPRLARCAPLAAPVDDPQAPVLIATARTPAFNADERSRLLAALTRLRDALNARNIPASWRLTGGLDRDLDVPGDLDSPLGESLANCRAVLTTPSTLLVEAMLAGRPAAIIHPHPAPLWPLAPVAWRDDCTADPRLDTAIEKLECTGMREVTLDGLIAFAASPAQADVDHQRDCLRLMHAQGSPADAVAAAVRQLIDSPPSPTSPPPPPTFARIPAPLAAATPARPRVVLMVSCDVTPIGGVMSWALRMARQFAQNRSLGFDLRVLAVLTDPAAMQASPTGETFDLNPDQLTSICQIDPYDDRHVIVETVAAALARLRPDIVLPGFHDVCWMAAMQARGSADRPGARTIAVAHSDEPYYADLMRFYNRWEAGVAVSARCREWMSPLLAGRPCATIPYSVPLADAPRTPAPQNDAPLQIAYVGRMVRLQKRIFDLLGVIDGLERRGATYHFHMVGDGADLAEWTAHLRKRTLRSGRVTLHGRRDVEWIQRLLPTIDASVLVSDFEGTSVTMLEAMGHGVVPVVTRIASGVSEWIEDGRNGITVPIGEPDQMAEQLAALAADRDLLARLGRAGWERVRRDLSPDRIAAAWADLFHLTMAARCDRRPTDLGVRSMENWRWIKQWADDPDGARAWCRGVLERAGYNRITDDAPEPGCDAVVARSCGSPPEEEAIESWRSAGLGVALAPLLMLNVTERVKRLIQHAADAGARRIVLYGVGRHSRKMPLLFREGLPIVGFTDDRPPAGPDPTLYGLPIVPFDQVEQRLRPDAVLLSTDTFERQMWERCAPLRNRGVRIITVYNSFDDEAHASPPRRPRLRPAASGAR